MADRVTAAMAYAKAHDAEQGLAAHEKLCAERYLNIHGRINMIFRILSWAGPLAVAVIIGVASWGLNRVFEGQQAQLALLKSVRAEVASPAGP